MGKYQDVTELEKENKALSDKLAMLQQERRQYRDALLGNCYFSYTFDVTEGRIYSEFTTTSGVNLIRMLGLKVPVDYDEMNEKWAAVWHPRFIKGEMAKLLKREELLARFESGATEVEIEYYTPETDAYTRTVTLMFRDEADGHVHAFVFANDTTDARREEERKRRELLAAKDALEDAYEAANRASAAKTKFLSSMSHDMRTPMNAIIGMTAIAEAHLDDPERVADCLNKISVAGKHLLGLINEVLDMSKIESGKVDLNAVAFHLPDLIDDLLTMSRPQAEARKHMLSVSVMGLTHEKVIGDSQRIQQAFMNLMSNAIKYTPEGGRIELLITEKQTNNPKVGCYEFVFRDNGIGMDKAFLEHLFEPFARAEDERVQKMQGTGLGMAITRNIVQMMNGDIAIDSEKGKGTKVTVTIYLQLQEDDGDISYEDFEKLSVLVVDGDKSACKSACGVLKELGMRAAGVLSVEAAMEKIITADRIGDGFWAVILDWNMVGMDGTAIIEEIRRSAGKDAPKMMISAYDWPDIEQEAKAAGADAFVGKPLFKSRMAQSFRKLLGGVKEPEGEDTPKTPSKERFAGKRALLVEDNEINAEIAREILGMAGIETDWAENGKKAVDIMTEAKDGDYDIIFMDIQMPVLNGYEAARAIRALPGDYAKRVPIIAMSANAFADDVQQAVHSGMNEHITKPIDIGQLMKTLKKWLSEG